MKGGTYNLMSLESELIHEQLRELIPEIRRRECTPRVMQPVDALLDQLLELERVDAPLE